MIQKKPIPPPPEFTPHPSSQLQPWAKTVDAFHRLSAFQSSSYTPQETEPSLFHKIFARHLFEEYKKVSTLEDSFSTLSFVCHTYTEVEASLFRLLKSFPKVIVKEPFGSSGQGIRLFMEPNITTADKNGILNSLKQHQALIVEPWFTRIADFSAQFKLERQTQKVIFLGITRFLTNAKGQYIATLLNKHTWNLSTHTKGYLYSNSSLSYFAHLEKIGLFVGEKLKEKGFSGHFGIDSFLFTSPGESQIEACYLSEINPRFTMGHVALEIKKRIHPGVLSACIHIKCSHLFSMGFSSFAEFANAMHEKHPLVVKNIIGGHKGTTPLPHIWEGVLFTNDPKHAIHTLSLVAVGEETIQTFLQLHLLPEYGENQSYLRLMR
jgi:hypothetical protein